MRDKATILDRGEGTLLTARGSAMFFKATRASTNGAFSLMERTLPPGGRKPPPHIHTNCEEAFYVLDGEVEFSLGGTTRSAALRRLCSCRAASPTPSAMLEQSRHAC
jgi:uncharacterized cupin superfamily protein